MDEEFDVSGDVMPTSHRAIKRNLIELLSMIPFDESLINDLGFCDEMVSKLEVLLLADAELLPDRTLLMAIFNELDTLMKLLTWWATTTSDVGITVVLMQFLSKMVQTTGEYRFAKELRAHLVDLHNNRFVVDLKALSSSDIDATRRGNFYFIESSSHF